MKRREPRKAGLLFAGLWGAAGRGAQASARERSEIRELPPGQGTRAGRLTSTV